MKTIFIVKCKSQFFDENEKINDYNVLAMSTEKEAKELVKKWNRRKKKSIYNIHSYYYESLTYFE